ncbi:MAG: ABC transporter substrate-binding protein [Chloroflexi bacterium]|nr:ABC transporter substrate-binding protein [Chloroflexota bacterium]
MRHSLLVRLMTLMVIVALTLVAVAACGGDDEETTTTSGSSTTTATDTSSSSSSAAAPTAAPAASTTDAMPADDAMMEPVVDVVVIGAIAPALISNNVGRGLGVQDHIQVKPMYEYLIGTDPISGELVPQLAESWAIEPNGQDFRVKLRDGIPFHNGAGTLTYRDVEFTVNEFGAEDATHPHARNYRTVEIEAISDLEFIWKLPRPLAEQERRMSEHIGGMEIMSVADYEALGEEFVTSRPLAGTNGYQFESREQESYIRFERIPDEHWRHTPEFASLEYRWTNEESTRLAGLLAGEIHITQLGADSTELVQRDGFRVEQGGLPGQRIFGAFKGGYLDTTYTRYEAQGTPCGYVHCDSPFVDPNVRKAMNKAIDKDALNQAFFRGAGVNMIMSGIPEDSPAFNPAWRDAYDAEYGFDPAAAHTLLEMSGYGPSNPLEITVQVIPVGGYPQAPDVMEAMAGMWNDAGISTTIDQTPAATFRGSQQALEFSNYMSLFSGAPINIQSFRVHNSNIPPRGGGFEYLEISDLIHQVQATMGEDAQNVILRQIGDIAFPAHIAVKLFYIPPQIVLNPDVVESWKWPGNIAGLWSHFDQIRAVKK